MDDSNSNPAGIELAPRVRAPESALRWQFARSSGPGGQNVNKVNTKAEVCVRVDGLSGMNERSAARLHKLAGKRLTSAGEIHIAADSERTQEGNRAAVLDRLRELIVEAMREPRIRRRTTQKKVVNRLTSTQSIHPGRSFTPSWWKRNQNTPVT